MQRLAKRRGRTDERATTTAPGRRRRARRGGDDRRAAVAQPPCRDDEDRPAEQRAHHARGCLLVEAEQQAPATSAPTTIAAPHGIATASCAAWPRGREARASAAASTPTNAIGPATPTATAVSSVAASTAPSRVQPVRDPSARAVFSPRARLGLAQQLDRGRDRRERQRDRHARQDDPHRSAAGDCGDRADQRGAEQHARRSMCCGGPGVDAGAGAEARLVRR